MYEVKLIDGSTISDPRCTRASRGANYVTLYTIEDVLTNKTVSRGFLWWKKEEMITEHHERCITLYELPRENVLSVEYIEDKQL